MKQDVRQKKAAVKASVYKVDAATAGMRYLKLAAWAPGLAAQDSVEINAPPTLAGGKLTVLRFRLAQAADFPIAVARYDQPEFNTVVGAPDLYDAMELVDTIPASSGPDDANAQILFYQELKNLGGGETLLAVSELLATNQDDVLKTLGSKVILADSPTAVDIPPSTPKLTFNNAVQVHKDNLHHVTSSKAGILQVPSGTTGTKYVNRVVWSPQGFDGNCSGQCDVIEDNSGRLGVLRFKPASAALSCLADIAPIGGNGTVNIDDLLAVINSWGTCPAIPAVCGGDVNDDGFVNIDDLLAVINGWGPCTGEPGPNDSVPQSVTECMTRANQLFPEGGDRWQKYYAGCLQNLCDMGIVQCDE